MSFQFTEEEWDTLEGIPEDDVVALSAYLSIVKPEVVDRRALLEQCIPRALRHCRQHGLPFTRYDREELEALPPHQFQALERIQKPLLFKGARGMIVAGRLAWLRYYKGEELDHHPLIYMLPSLLGPLSRLAAEKVGSGD